MINHRQDKTHVTEANGRAHEAREQYRVIDEIAWWRIDRRAIDNERWINGRIEYIRVFFSNKSDTRTKI